MPTVVLAPAAATWATVKITDWYSGSEVGKDTKTRWAPVLVH